MKEKSNKRDIHVLLKILATAMTAIASAASALAQGAQTQSLPPSLPLEQQETVDHANKALEALGRLSALVDEVSAIKFRQCTTAIGIPEFCDCITRNTPVAIDFTQYVIILSKTKEELHYEQLSAHDKQVVDNARTARDLCVKSITSQQTELPKGDRLGRSWIERCTQPTGTKHPDCATYESWPVCKGLFDDMDTGAQLGERCRPAKPRG